MQPCRLAHRIRDMQRLPYVVVTNPHINEVYNLYYNAFDTFRKIKEVKTLEDNDRMCSIIGQNLKSHLTVIPKLAMGILECGGLMNPNDLDKFMNTILRSVRLSALGPILKYSQATIAHLSAGHCRAAPVSLRDLQLTSLLPRYQTLRSRLHRRSFHQMQR